MAKEIYTIQVLDDKDYDTLHKQLSYVKEESLKDSLGFADKETGNAYVRKTAVKEMDAMTIQHEIQELISKNSSHEDENNIRWKKFRDIIKNIISPILGAVLAPVTGGLSVLGSGLLSGGLQGREVQKGNAPWYSIPIAGGTAALGAYTGGKAVSGFMTPGTTATTAGMGEVLTKPTFMQRVGGAIKGALGQGAVGSVSGGVPSTISAGKQVADVMGKPVTFGQTAMPSVSPAGVLSAPTQNILGSTNVGQIQKQQLQPPAPAKPFEITSSTALGAGSLAASMGLKQPEFKMPSSVEDIRSKLLAGGQLTPLGLQAQTELSGILKSTPQELYPTANDAYYEAMTRRIDENYANALEELDKAYNRAGIYGSGEHLSERASLQEEQARTKSGISAEIEQRRFELARTAKYQAIQDALNVDKNVMDDLVGITGLDVQTAAMAYGAKVEDIQQIREALGTLGTEMILRGQGMGGFQQGLGAFNITPAVR